MNSISGLSHLGHFSLMVAACEVVLTETLKACSKGSLREAVTIWMLSNCAVETAVRQTGHLIRSSLPGRSRMLSQRWQKRLSI